MCVCVVCVCVCVCVCINQPIYRWRKIEKHSNPKVMNVLWKKSRRYNVSVLRNHQDFKNDDTKYS